MNKVFVLYVQPYNTEEESKLEEITSWGWVPRYGDVILRRGERWEVGTTMYDTDAGEVRVVAKKLPN